MSVDPPEQNSPLRWGRRPVRIALPTWVMAVVPPSVDVPTAPVRRGARALTFVLPIAMMSIGLPVAIVAALLEERDGFGPIGAFGVEAGALVWGAGAVLLGARPGPTVRRVLMLALATLGGLALIATALFVEMSDAWVGLMMEFGVGAIGVSFIDTVLLGLLYGRLDSFARSPDDGTVTVSLRRPWRLRAPSTD
jgi:hypothetical protein